MADPKARGAHVVSLVAQGKEQKKNLEMPISVGSRRIALERKITLDFPHFQGFLTEYSSNLSMTGMFVKSSRPEAPGTVVAFEFRLADGLNLIRGQAEVVWRRFAAEGEERPAGMGLRFVRLDRESRRLIRWAVEKQMQDGADAFQLDAPPGGLSAAATDSVAGLPLVHPGSEEEARRSKLHPYAGAAAAKSELERRRPILYAVAACLAAAGLLAYFLRPGAASPAAPPPEPVPAPTVAAPAPPVAAPDVSPSPITVPPAAAVPALAAPAPPEPEAGEDLADILAAVEAWALAWSQQRADDYLAFYAADFSPPGGASRGAWSAERRERISRPRRIEVRITDLDAERLGPESARVSFQQLYVSDSFRDTTRKTLRLVREDGGWKIAEEQSGP